MTMSIYNILYGTSNNFTSIWCDPETSLTNGRFYVGREDDLTIISNNSSQAYVEDYYLTTTSGESGSPGETGEVLNAGDSIDINVVY